MQSKENGTVFKFDGKREIQVFVVSCLTLNTQRDRERGW